MYFVLDLNKHPELMAKYKEYDQMMDMKAQEIEFQIKTLQNMKRQKDEENTKFFDWLAEEAKKLGVLPEKYNKDWHMSIDGKSNQVFTHECDGKHGDHPLAQIFEKILSGKTPIKVVDMGEINLDKPDNNPTTH